jgi:ribosomal protein S27E
VTLSAIVLLLVASVIHGWYAGNASLPHGHAASLVRYHGGFILVVFTLLLVGALILLWSAKGFWFAVGGVGAYFFLLPLITLPLLTAIGLVPTKLSCPQCGSEYEIISRKVSWRDSDSIECNVCGHMLKKWSGSRIYTAMLIKRGEWPKKQSTQV